MREKLMRFMYGRYGTDYLNRFILGLALLFLVLSFFGVPFAYVVSLVLLGYTYFRMFSRQIPKRQAENQWYMGKRYKVACFFQKKKKELAERKQFHIYKCPRCKQKLRVPRGRGKIIVSCRKCGAQFQKNS